MVLTLPLSSLAVGELWCLMGVLVSADDAGSSSRFTLLFRMSFSICSSSSGVNARVRFSRRLIEFNAELEPELMTGEVDWSERSRGSRGGWSASESASSLLEVGVRKLCSDSSKERFAVEAVMTTPESSLIDGSASGSASSDESASSELRSVADSPPHQGEARHSDAVWYDDDRDAPGVHVQSDAVTKDSSSVDLTLELQSCRERRKYKVSWYH